MPLFIDELLKKINASLTPLLTAGKQAESPNEMGYEFRLPENQVLEDGEFNEDYCALVASQVMRAVKVHTEYKNRPIVSAHAEILHYGGGTATVGAMLLFGDNA